MTAGLGAGQQYRTQDVVFEAEAFGRVGQLRRYA